MIRWLVNKIYFRFSDRFTEVLNRIEWVHNQVRITNVEFETLRQNMFSFFERIQGLEDSITLERRRNDAYIDVIKKLEVRHEATQESLNRLCDGLVGQREELDTVEADIAWTRREIEIISRNQLPSIYENLKEITGHQIHWERVDKKITALEKHRCNLSDLKKELKSFIEIYANHV